MVVSNKKDGLTAFYSASKKQKMFYFHPYFGEDSHFDEHIFQMGWFNHQLGMGGFLN